MSLAKRLREAREAAGMTQDELADKAEISKTYLWEIEKDERGEKKPSAEILLRIANALSITLAELMELPVVQMQTKKVALSRTLQEFRDRMKKLGDPLSERDLRELASISFRGGQPRTVDEWHELYLTLDRMSKRKKHGEKSE